MPIVALVALAAAVPAIELLVFRRWGWSPAPGPYELNGTVGDGAGPARWVWLGDSLSAGVGAERADEALPRLTAARVAADAGCSVDLRCVAVPGAACADVLEGQVPLAVGLLGEGTVAIVAVGCNDVLQLVRPTVFRARYAAVIEALAATGATVFAVGIPDLGSMIAVMHQPLRSMVGASARYLDRIVREVARDAGAEYVAVAAPMPPAMLSADRLHPNGRGYRAWASLVAARINEDPERRAAPG